MSYAHQLLADILTAQGVPADKAARAAEVIMAAQVAAGLVQVRVLEAVERDARAYHLRGERLTAVIVAQRLSLSRVAVYDAIKRHIQRRRAVLRLIA